MQELTPFEDKNQPSIGEIADYYARQNIFVEAQQGKAHNTRRRYQNDLELFSQFLEEAGIYVSADELYDNPQYWSQVSYGLVKGFMQWQLKKGYAVGSCNVRLFTIRKFCGLAFEAGAIDDEKLALILRIKGFNGKEARNIDRKRETTRRSKKKATPIFLSDEQVAQLKLQAAEQGSRNLLLICLLVDHGLRCGEAGRSGEVEQMKVSSISISAGTITFYREKVDRTQTHRLSNDALEAARKYLPAIPTNGPLFYGYQGKALCSNTINHIVRQLGQKIGIANLSPHDLRHTWATRAARSGTTLQALMEAGGWKTVKVALSYIEANKIANDGVVLG